MTVKEFMSTYIHYLSSIDKVVIFPSGVHGIEHNEHYRYYVLATIGRMINKDDIEYSIKRYHEKRKERLVGYTYRFDKEYSYTADDILNFEVVEIGCIREFVLALHIKEVKIEYNMHRGLI